MEKLLKDVELPKDFVQIESCCQENLKSSTYSNISKWTPKSWWNTQLEILLRIFQGARQRATKLCSMANLEIFRTAESNWLEAVNLAKGKIEKSILKSLVMVQIIEIFGLLLNPIKILITSSKKMMLGMLEKILLILIF